VAEAAVDGEQELRRSSGKTSRSGRRRSRMGVRECKSESVGSSGTYFKSRRRHDEGEQVLANSAACVVVRAAAARCGGAGRGPARGEERRARCWSGTWREVERREGSWGSGNWLARAVGSGVERSRVAGLEVDEGGLVGYL
jgi:hypothetical protein